MREQISSFEQRCQARRIAFDFGSESFPEEEKTSRNSCSSVGGLWGCNRKHQPRYSYRGPNSKISGVSYSKANRHTRHVSQKGVPGAYHSVPAACRHTSFFNVIFGLSEEFARKHQSRSWRCWRERAHAASPL